MDSASFGLSWPYQKVVDCCMVAPEELDELERWRDRFVGRRRRLTVQKHVRNVASGDHTNFRDVSRTPNIFSVIFNKVTFFCIICSFYLVWGAEICESAL